MSNADNIIPLQKEGTAVDVEDSVELSNEREAEGYFQQVKHRLLNINSWQDYAGSLSADFELTDSNGTKATRPPQKGDYFKIDIPAPGIKTGQGYDWVRIEEIVEKSEGIDEYASIRVRPASSPLNKNSDVAHFYTDEATSNFIIKREGRKVTAGVHGRNEKPNVQAADGLLDKVRNAIVGTGGVSGFAKLQWKALVSGLLNSAYDNKEI